MRGPIAAPIDQVEWFGGVGQRDQQGMITPGAVVGDVDPLFALGIGADQGAIDVEDRFGKELGGLLGPDPQPRLIDGVHQVNDIGFEEPAAEVAGGGGVGDALGTQGIEVDLIVAPQLEVLDPSPAREDVEGDVQDVVGFVVREVSLEELEVAVDVADQSGPARQQEHGADAAGTEAVDPVSEFIMDVGGGHHGPLAIGFEPILDAFEESPPAIAEGPAVAFAALIRLAFPGFLGDSRSHSKTSVDWNGEDV